MAFSLMQQGAIKGAIVPTRDEQVPEFSEIPKAIRRLSIDAAELLSTAVSKSTTAVTNKIHEGVAKLSTQQPTMPDSDSDMNLDSYGATRVTTTAYATSKHHKNVLHPERTLKEKITDALPTAVTQPSLAVQQLGAPIQDIISGIANLASSFKKSEFEKISDKDNTIALRPYGNVGIEVQQSFAPVTTPRGDGFIIVMQETVQTVESRRTGKITRVKKPIQDPNLVTHPAWIPKRIIAVYEVNGRIVWPDKNEPSPYYGVKMVEDNNTMITWEPVMLDEKPESVSSTNNEYTTMPARCDIRPLEALVLFLHQMGKSPKEIAEIVYTLPAQFHTMELGNYMYQGYKIPEHGCWTMEGIAQLEMFERTRKNEEENDAKMGWKKGEGAEKKGAGGSMKERQKAKRKLATAGVKEIVENYFYYRLYNGHMPTPVALP